MSDRRKRHSLLDRLGAVSAAVLVHAVIIIAVVVNIYDNTENVKAHDAEKIDIVKAQTIDESQIKQNLERIKQQDRKREQEKEREQKRLQDLKKEADQEKLRLEELAKQRKEQEQKAIALQKQAELEEQERQKQERERLAKEKKEQEEKAKKEQQRLAKLEQQRKEDEAQQQLNQLLRDEEAKIAEHRTTTAISKAMAEITNKIYGVRTVHPSFELWRKSEVEVAVTETGVVRAVRTIKSSGLPAYDKAAETAVFKASPLPIPDQQAQPEAHRQFTADSFVLEITM